MRILYKPKVYCVGRPQLNTDGWGDFLQEQNLKWPTPTDVEDAAVLTELMGRLCYMSFGKKAGSKTNQAYINNLIGKNVDGTFFPGPSHGSVLEHTNWNFVVVGAGRGFSHELVRHRVGTGFSQLSLRYCDFERAGEAGTWEPGFCVPNLGQLSDKTRELFEAKYKADQEYYKLVLDSIMEDLNKKPEYLNAIGKSPKERDRVIRKAARGAARDVLPIGAEAIMGFTANARALWNIAYLRASGHAEGAIRDVFVQIVKIMEVEFPTLFKDIEFEELWDGSVAVKLPKSKL